MYFLFLLVELGCDSYNGGGDGNYDNIYYDISKHTNGVLEGLGIDDLTLVYCRYNHTLTYLLVSYSQLFAIHPIYVYIFMLKNNILNVKT